MTPHARLAARAAARQIDALALADDAALAAGRAVGRVWRALSALLAQTPRPDPFTLHRQAHAVLAGLLPAVARETHAALSAVAAWGHRTSAQSLAREAPLPALLSALSRRRRGLTEAVALGRDDGGELVTAELGPTRALPGTPEKLDVFAGRGFFNHPLFHPLDPWHEAAPNPPVVSEEEARRLVLDLLFPPLTREQADRLVFAPSGGMTWTQRLAASTSLAAPEQLASAIAQGVAAGQTREQLVQTLLPVLDNVRTSAERIARTEGLRVAHDTMLRQHESLGPMVVGYQIHCTLDHHTRSWHAARSGTIYYRHPKPGQKGFHQMPQPPMEAPDPAERPPGTPQVAHNCRCFLTPILAPPKAARNPDHEATLARAVVPDPATYSRWFDRASERKRRLAVGTRRYDAARDAAGGRPDWALFLDPATGGLLSAEQLRAESASARNQRVAQVEAMLAGREKDLRRGRAFGYLPG